jgi:hypothetical protein
MAHILTLWLPILLSAVGVFIASSIMHMVLPYHRSDYKQVPNEEVVLAPLRAAKLPPGLYTFPYCTHKDMNTPEKQEKFKQGPVGLMTLFPNQPPAMPKFLGLWFVFCLLVSVFVAYLTYHGVPTGSRHRTLLHVSGTAAFLGYGLARFSDGIWRGAPWGNVAKEMFDALIFAIVTAVIFMFFWPR